MTGLRVDLWESDGGFRWRMWNSSRIVGQSSEAYRARSRAISNMETVTGGVFDQVSTPEHPEPYGVLYRSVREITRVDENSSLTSSDQRIPVRLVVPE